MPPKLAPVHAPPPEGSTATLDRVESLVLVFDVFGVVLYCDGQRSEEGGFVVRAPQCTVYMLAGC